MNHPSEEDPRFIKMPGGINFRDFGGYPTKDGQRLRRGRLFRCGAMMNMTEDAHDVFAALNVGVICDLRRDDEVAMAPTPTAEIFGCRVHIPIAPGSSPDLRESLENPDHTYEDRIRYMKDITREIARDHVDAYRQVFSHLVHTSKGFLIHCTAGKDRTGFGAAMIKLALGVSESIIMEDYLLSNDSPELLDRLMPRMRDQGMDLDIDTFKALAGVREEYLQAALADVEKHFGGTDGYLEAAGLDAAARQHLRERLLEPA